MKRYSPIYYWTLEQKSDEIYHQKLKTDLHVTCDPLPTPPELVFDVTWSIYLEYGC